MTTPHLQDEDDSMTDEDASGTTVTQTFPWPQPLQDLVDETTYRPGWKISLERDKIRDTDMDGRVLSRGPTLAIKTHGHNSRHVEWGPNYEVHHYFPVPPATYDSRSWRRWLFERYLEVERHEAMEFFCIGGDHPFAPSHGPGQDCYLVREVGTDEDQRTSFRGALNP